MDQPSDDVSVVEVAMDELLSHGGAGPTGFGRHRARLAAMLEEWRSFAGSCPGACEDCGHQGVLRPLQPGWHLAACGLHPGRLAEAWARETLRALGGAVPESAPPIGPAGWVDGPQFESLFSWPPELHRFSPAQLAVVVEEWGRLKRGRHLRCLFCGVEQPRAEALRHARSCPHHPATLHAVALERVLAERCPDPAARLAAQFVVGRAQAEHLLRQLLDACATYEASMGWAGDEAYTKKWSEWPWRSALGEAKARVKALAARAAERSAPNTPEDEAAAHRREACCTAAMALEVASWDFWNRMRDGDDGRSLISRALARPWNAARKAAQAVLDQPLSTTPGTG